MEWLIRLFVRHRLLLLLVSGLFVGGFAVFLPRFQISPKDPAPIVYPSPDDPERIYFEKMQQNFEDGATIYIGVRSADVFQPSLIDKTKRITEDVGRLPGVSSVLSLANATEIEGDEGTLRSREILSYSNPRERIARNPLLKGRIVSDDGTLAPVIVTLASGMGAAEERATIDGIQEIVRRERGPEEILLTGPRFVNREIETTTFKDIQLQVPILCVLCFVLLFFNFRKVGDSLLGFAVIFFGIAATFGFMGIASIPLTPLTGTIPGTLLVTGISYTLYLLSEFYSQSRRAETSDRNRIVAEVLRQVWLAVLLCALTTLIGFASLCTNSIVAIRQMGLAAAVGTVLMLILNSVTLSAGLFYLPEPKRRAEKAHSPDFLDRGLHHLHNFALRRRGWVLAASAILALAGVWGMTKVRSETDLSKFFNEHHPIRLDIEEFRRLVGGTSLFDLVLEGKDGKSSDRFKNPVLLKQVDVLQAEIRRIPKVTQVLSVNDHLKWAHSVLNEGEASEATIPDTQAGVAQLLLVYQMADSRRDLAHFLTDDASSARMTVRTSESASRDIGRLGKQMEDLCRKTVSADLTCKVTGELPLIARSARDITEGMMRGLAWGVLIIGVLIILVFRSVKMGLIAMVPNVLPIIVSLGFIGWAGFELDVATSLMAPIVIGMTVDDTLRFFVRYFYELRQTNHYLIRQMTGVRVTEDQKVAMKIALEEVSRPMVMASLIIICGFGSFILSSFVPVERLGLMTALTMLTCVLGDLLLLPAILASIRI